MTDDAALQRARAAAERAQVLRADLYAACAALAAAKREAEEADGSITRTLRAGREALYEAKSIMAAATTAWSSATAVAATSPAPATAPTTPLYTAPPARPPLPPVDEPAVLAAAAAARLAAAARPPEPLPDANPKCGVLAGVDSAVRWALESAAHPSYIAVRAAALRTPAPPTTVPAGAAPTPGAPAA
ncbi:MAG TPA: hypothetical protein VKY74_26215, partial [Chloroflexia bacterium]|nr:hypothetical protein [Chloroflexia bacterium]